MTVRILVNAKALADLLADNPDVEIELLNNATAQVAEQLKHKIDKGGLAQTIYANLEFEIREKMGHRYRFPKEVTAEIDKAVNDAVDGAINSKIYAALNKAVERAVGQAEILISKQIAIVIEKKFKDMVEAAARLKR